MQSVPLISPSIFSYENNNCKVDSGIFFHWFADDKFVSRDRELYKYVENDKVGVYTYFIWFQLYDYNKDGRYDKDDIKYMLDKKLIPQITSIPVR